MNKKNILVLFLAIFLCLSGCRKKDSYDPRDEFEYIDPEYPNVKVESKYYHYLNVNSVKDLKDYFEIYDEKDGIIPVTDEMISGSIKEGSNVISIKVTDSDNNITEKSITIYVGSYSYYTYKESVKKINKYSMPSTGNVKALVIPIKLTSSKPATEEMRTNIEKAFFGTSEETGWESLSSYYKKSSYGKLNISGTVTSWFTPSKSAFYYANYSDNDNYYSGSTIILNEALEYFKDKIDYSDYDSDNNGYIDAVYLIYNNNIYGNQSAKEWDFFWAYQTSDYNASNRLYSDTKAYNYIFMGYDFLLEELTYSSAKIDLNAQTIIHETAHLFEIPDYYDYDTKDKNDNDGGYVGFDMMEDAIGDHNPFTKIIANWLDLVVIDKSGIYELPAYSEGIAFAISADGWFNTIFEEYFLIDFLTLDGLNSLEVPTYLNTKKSYAGVRITHADATLTYEAGYFPYFTYDNSETKHKMLSLIEADFYRVPDLKSSLNDGATMKDFFLPGDKLHSYYNENFKCHNGNYFPFDIEVISIENDIATVKIILK